MWNQALRYGRSHPIRTTLASVVLVLALAALSGGFIATADPADFAIQLQLDEAGLTDLNPFLLSQTGVDVADGLFRAILPGFLDKQNPKPAKTS